MIWRDEATKRRSNQRCDNALILQLTKCGRGPDVVQGSTEANRSGEPTILAPLSPMRPLEDAWRYGDNGDNGQGAVGGSGGAQNCSDTTSPRRRSKARTHSST